MSFFTVDANVMRKNCTAFFIIMAISWGLMFALAPFGTDASNASPGVYVPAIILFFIYATAYVSPFITGLYSWFLVFYEKQAKTRLYSLVSAIIASGLAILIITWATTR